MSKFFDRTVLSLKDALAYAKGDCDHEWVTVETKSVAELKKCSKCGVRVTTWPGAR